MDYQILIAEDEEKLREVLGDYFQSKGDTCVLAKNGTEALELAESREFDAVLRIANDCEAFSEEELEKVWESFYRRDKARDRKGTGLGLAITRQILQLHGGSCQVKNTENGVEFSILLPN